ncbi:MAG: alpha/beta hydrolase family protein [Bacilli bacterium]
MKSEVDQTKKKTGLCRSIAKVAVAIMTTVVLGGCFPSVSSAHAKPTASHTVERNGKIASLTLMHESGEFANPKIRVFKMFYWSAGKKVEAWLTEPERPGHYPLLVFLHGGWAVYSRYTHHVTTIQGVQVFPNSPWNDLSSQIVSIYPAYRGYGESQGSVHGMLGDTLDAENAMLAALSLHHVKPNDTYLSGVSMGGGVALMLASEQKGIRAVVANSPFVGWDITAYWAKKLNESSIFDTPFATQDYGETHIAIRSPYDHTSTIHAPVLLLQGEEDHHVIWQTVESLYQRMKKDGKVVNLVLYKTGHHALGHKHWFDSTFALIQWFNRYGLPGPFSAGIMNSVGL